MINDMFEALGVENSEELDDLLENMFRNNRETLIEQLMEDPEYLDALARFEEAAENLKDSLDAEEQEAFELHLERLEKQQHEKSLESYKKGFKTAMIMKYIALLNQEQNNEEPH